MSWIKNNILPEKTFIIAEAGINHNGHFDLALELVKKAKSAGADCIKFQTFRTTSSESKHSTMPGYFTGRIGQMTKQEWSQSLEFTVDQFVQLKAFCEEVGIAFLSTACDIEGLEILEKIGVGAIKIASADVKNDYLLRATAQTGLPVILSTGMSTESDVERSIHLLRAYGTTEIVLMQCTSQYPTPIDQVNLRVIERFKRVFQLPVGFSDHTQGIHAAVAAAALGACAIEKHFTLSRNLPGVDHAASLDCSQFTEMVDQIRDVEKALGSGQKNVEKDEAENAVNMCRSLMAARDLKAGTILKMDDIAAKRPGTGMPPAMLDSLLGKRLLKNMQAEDMFFPHLICET